MVMLLHYVESSGSSYPRSGSRIGTLTGAPGWFGERNEGAVTEKDADLAVLDAPRRAAVLALHASRASDLRFLDALNYYYELLPVGWQPKATQHKQLLISFFALYARVLAAWI